MMENFNLRMNKAASTSIVVVPMAPNNISMCPPV